MPRHRFRSLPYSCLTSKQIGLLHVAKKRLGLDEDDYRALLSREAGVESAKALDNEGFRRVMNAFKRLGFTSDWRKRIYGKCRGMASPSQVDLIRNLWCEWSDEGTDAGLNGWLERKFGSSALRFATPEVVGKAITALKAMVRRKESAS